MQVPLQIRFHDLEPSEFVEAAVRKHAERLERFNSRIISCRVSVAAAHKRHHKGNLYRVTVDVRTPAGEVAVSRSPEAHHEHEDVYVAIRDAFNAARRRLQDRARVQRGKVKTHCRYLRADRSSPARTASSSRSATMPATCRSRHRSSSRSSPTPRRRRYR